MQIHNAVITGSFSYNGADLSNVTSSNQSSASLSTRVTQIEQVYATTGSNSFRATQSITGSLTVTGQIVAQTLNVQQVTSSIVYSSGSNVFGCDLNSRQTFTGSVLITGSLTSNAPITVTTCFPGILSPLTINNTSGFGFYNGAESTLDFNYGRNETSTGYINYVGYQAGSTQFRNLIISNGKNADITKFEGCSKNAIFYGNVGIGTYPSASLHSFAGNAGASGRIRLTHATSGAQIDLYAGVSDGTGIIVNNNPLWFEVNSVERLRITSDGTLQVPYGKYLQWTAYSDACSRSWAIRNNETSVGDFAIVSSTNNSNSLSAVRLSITNGGYVGIGENSPWHKLVVKTATNNNFDLYDNSTGIGIQSVSDNNVGYRTMTIGASVLTYQNATGVILTFNSNGAITWTNSTYMISGTAGFRFNNSTDAYNNFIASDNGNATLRGTLTQNASDVRLKNNVQTIQNALNKINQLRGITFEWNKEIYETSRTTDIGVIAQDVQEVLPDAVTLAPFDTDFDTHTSKSGQNYLTVYYEKIIPLLIEGIKELKCENDIFKTCLGIS